MEVERYSQTATTTANFVVEDIPPIGIVEEYRIALDDLERVANELACRLEPVLRPDEPTQAGSEPRDIASPVRTALWRLQHLTSCVANLTYRLEV